MASGFGGKLNWRDVIDRWLLVNSNLRRWKQSAKNHLRSTRFHMFIDQPKGKSIHLPPPAASLESFNAPIGHKVPDFAD